MNTLADARNELVEALERAELVAEALRDRPERDEVLRRFDELRVVAYRSLAMLTVESPFANAVAEGLRSEGSPRFDAGRISTPRLLEHGAPPEHRRPVRQRSASCSASTAWTRSRSSASTSASGPSAGGIVSRISTSSGIGPAEHVRIPDEVWSW